MSTTRPAGTVIAFRPRTGDRTDRADKPTCQTSQTRDCAVRPDLATLIGGLAFMILLGGAAALQIAVFLRHP